MLIWTRGPRLEKPKPAQKKRIISEKERQLGYAPQAQEVSKLGLNKSPKKENTHEEQEIQRPLRYGQCMVECHSGMAFLKE